MLAAITPIEIIFYLFAIMATFSAIFVITARHPVKSVLALVVTFFAMSGVWMLLRAEFLSLILLLVYVGAVMTLFLFVVMMLPANSKSSQHFVRYFPMGLIIVLLLIGILMTALMPQKLGLPAVSAINNGESNLQSLGNLLYTEYVYAFEIAGILLLAAIIAAIALAFRGPLKRRVQSTSKQLTTKPENAVRLVKMPTESTKGS